MILGAGAAGLATAGLLLRYEIPLSHLTLIDTQGVLYEGRKDTMNEWKEMFKRETKCRTLHEAMVDCDIFIGLAGKDLVTVDDVKSMGEKPIIFACANPEPEIHPDIAKEAGPDAIVASGRADFPNQVIDWLVFPFIYRAVLDMRCKRISTSMMIAAAEAIAKVATMPIPDNVKEAYPGKDLEYGPGYILPTPFDKGLLSEISAAIAGAACHAGLGEKCYKNIDDYKKVLEAGVEAKKQAIGDKLDADKEIFEAVGKLHKENTILESK